MEERFRVGEQCNHTFVVQAGDVAAFQGEVVHPVCATFVLAREIEWCSRLFVLAAKRADEEGIGTRLSINHCGPALVGQQVDIMAEIVRVDKGELICAYRATVGGRLVAEGETGQRLLPKAQIAALFARASK
jgi:fluoroacetyl-CoA thioesterase